jgi:hypothetical protein
VKAKKPDGRPAVRLFFGPVPKNKKSAGGFAGFCFLWEKFRSLYHPFPFRPTPAPHSLNHRPLNHRSF